MEFFAIARIHTNAEGLRRITMDRLPQFSPSIERLVTVHDDDHARAWTVWGEFDIVRLPVTGGVRFVLTDCANALTWSLTTGHPPQPDAVTVHATINRPEQDPEFVETIEGFVEEWREALEREFG
ncbi:hypothetical protein B1C78_07095 [Thioalkalivibrio denitrificans]|uniref:Uncharacterized protein n=1 Tax=Thioalkalivibrio denitrificans TaxID=108003 RepID=A0A1V3NK92_9GAMM|nr:hypothetical protein [Thioalkalivibrio denitrificans]OOG25176.1 hypothetical protein B1C78_07095 [Thioalkalivibrio denitrificans]